MRGFVGLTNPVADHLGVYGQLWKPGELFPCLKGWEQQAGCQVSLLVTFTEAHLIVSLDYEEVKAKWGFWRNKFLTVWQVNCSSDWSWISKRLWTSVWPTAFPEGPSRIHYLWLKSPLFQYYPLHSYNFHVLYSHLNKYFESTTFLKNMLHFEEGSCIYGKQM